MDWSSCPLFRTSLPIGCTRGDIPGNYCEGLYAQDLEPFSGAQWSTTERSRSSGKNSDSSQTFWRDCLGLLVMVDTPFTVYSSNQVQLYRPFCTSVPTWNNCIAWSCTQRNTVEMGGTGTWPCCQTFPSHSQYKYLLRVRERGQHDSSLIESVVPHQCHNHVWGDETVVLLLPI